MSGGRLGSAPAAASPDHRVHRRTRSHAARTFLVLLVILLSGACRVRTDVGIEVKENGSGTVTVRIGLDDDAMKKAPNFQQALKVDDLTAHGWTVTGPAKETDGFSYVAASKPFANPDEAKKILLEVSGEKGPFRDFAITRTRSFAHTRFRFSGTIDFAGGLEAFSDSQLAQDLDGKPIGDDIKAIEQRINDTLDNVFQFRVAVRLPGDVTSNAPGQATNGAVWQPRLSQPGAITLEASSSSTRWFTIIGTAAAVVAAIGIIVVLVVRFILVRRRRTPAR
ncbi:MAG: hypothetical protein QOC92_2352 [Acidimicrobiaceae bacterium]